MIFHQTCKNCCCPSPTPPSPLPPLPPLLFPFKSGNYANACAPRYRVFLFGVFCCVLPPSSTGAVGCRVSHTSLSHATCFSQQTSKRSSAIHCAVRAPFPQCIFVTSTQVRAPNGLALRSTSRCCCSPPCFNPSLTSSPQFICHTFSIPNPFSLMSHSSSSPFAATTSRSASGSGWLSSACPPPSATPHVT